MGGPASSTAASAGAAATAAGVEGAWLTEAASGCAGVDDGNEVSGVGWTDAGTGGVSHATSPCSAIAMARASSLMPAFSSQQGTRYSAGVSLTATQYSTPPIAQKNATPTSANAPSPMAAEIRSAKFTFASAASIRAANIA